MDSYHSIIHQNLSLLTCVFPNLDMESKLKNVNIFYFVVNDHNLIKVFPDNYKQ